VASGFKINKQGIRQFTREIEREFAKNPVRIPVEADPNGVVLPSASTVNNYFGPVVTSNGDNAQIAWGNGAVHQSQNVVEQITPGYEAVARLVTDLLANLDAFALPEDDAAEARVNADAVLSEVVKENPDQGMIKRGVTMLKGLLAPIAAGVGGAVTEESSSAAGHIIEELGSSLPF
jgi:hypothetical protein